MYKIQILQKCVERVYEKLSYIAIQTLGPLYLTNQLDIIPRARNESASLFCRLLSVYATLNYFLIFHLHAATATRLSERNLNDKNDCIQMPF